MASDRKAEGGKKGERKEERKALTMKIVESNISYCYQCYLFSRCGQVICPIIEPVIVIYKAEPTI
jgi:hypothetical protein